MVLSNAMFDVIKGDLERLEERLIEAVSSPEDELVTEVGTHLVTSGGKRIRPALCLLAAFRLDIEFVSVNVKQQMFRPLSLSSQQRFPV